MYIQLTNKNDKFSKSIADQINRDYPGQAEVNDGSCYIREPYWKYCLKYVRENCKIAPTK